jgi:hypothetical protein
MAELKKYLYTLNLWERQGKKIESIDLTLLSKIETGIVHVTDVQLQEGSQVTAHQVNTNETMKAVSFNIDEFAFVNSVNNPLKLGEAQPVKHVEVKNRFYNFVGRGHEVISIPNVYHEDYSQTLVTSALDLTLYAKDDFDLLRISTNTGAYQEGRYYDEEVSPNNPLNYRYTREFIFGGAKAEEEIKLQGSIKTATLNGAKVPLGQGNIIVNGSPMYIERQRLMGAPFGSFRIRVEFYKQVNGIMTDVGIGFWGIAEFRQYQQEKGVL